MAIAYINVQNISRGRGKSAVAAASYRSGETLHNEREGTTYAYPRKTDRVYTDILAPRYAPAWVYSRQKLWNEVEKIEKQSNARLAREVMIALPHEFTCEQNIELARAYAQTFANDGMIADLSIHDSGDGNPHAHIMLTTRPFNQTGTWGAKSKKVYMLDKNGQKIRLPSGEYKSRKVDATDWNSSEKLQVWRKRYEYITNDHLEKHGHEMRICVDSLEAQEIDRTPTVHLGHYAHQLEQRGTPSERGNINRRIEAENRERAHARQELARVSRAIDEEEARLREEEEVIRATRTISPEAFRAWAAREEARLQAALTQEQQSEPQTAARLEALAKEAERREEARNQGEQAREAQWHAQRRYTRAFVGRHRFERPARLVSRASAQRHAPRLHWLLLLADTSGQQANPRMSGRIDWARIREQQIAQRIDWKILDQQLQESRAEYWKTAARQLEEARPPWAKKGEQLAPSAYEELYHRGEERRRQQGGSSRRREEPHHHGHEEERGDGPKRKR